MISQKEFSIKCTVRLLFIVIIQNTYFRKFKIEKSASTAFWYQINTLYYLFPQWIDFLIGSQNSIDISSMSNEKIKYAAGNIENEHLNLNLQKSIR